MINKTLMILFIFLYLATAEASENDTFASDVEKIFGDSIVSLTKVFETNIYAIETKKEIIFGSSKDNILFRGEFFSINPELENLRKKYIRSFSKSKLANFSDRVITYKSDNEKYVIHVFTDTSCGYCKKLHSKIDEFNEFGISVKYLAFPRGGKSLSNSYLNMRSAWCSKSPKIALDQSFSGNSSKSVDCFSGIEDQYFFGHKIGVKATPSILLSDGSLLEGYISPSSLLEIINQ